MNSSFKQPPRLKNHEGNERRAGFEFEFTGIEMKQVATLIQELYGGEVEEISTYEFEVSGTELGPFELKLDARLFYEKSYEKKLESIGVDISSLENKNEIEQRLMDMASAFVPFEITTPPIPWSSFPEMNKLIAEMRNWKVQGTGSSIFNAFGMHINPEIPDEDPATLLDYLRAYVLLDQWIRKDAKIDISRRITPFINEFKPDYVEHILKEEYQPDLRTFISDYMEFDNTRNRPLDMLPLFMYLDEEMVDTLSDDERISARPAFHYRLPNCSVEDPEWSLADEWNRWVLVEQLAEDKKALNQYSRAFLKMKRELMFGAESKWVKLMERWVNNHA